MHVHQDAPFTYVDCSTQLSYQIAVRRISGEKPYGGPQPKFPTTGWYVAPQVENSTGTIIVFGSKQLLF